MAPPDLFSDSLHDTVQDPPLVHDLGTLSENDLKDMSIEEINQALANRAGKGNANVNVKAQALVPFMIVFEDLPDNLSEFIVEAVSSAPGR